MAGKCLSFFIACWKAELRAAEAAADRVAELAHRAMAARYAKLAAAEYARLGRHTAPQPAR